MGHTVRGVYPEHNGTWTVNKQYGGERVFKRGFATAAEAQDWLITTLGALRERHLYGVRPRHSFDEAAARYLLDHQDKPSLETEIHLLKTIMPYVGALALEGVHDGTLEPYVTARLEAGRAHKTINLALGIVRHILNLAARNWRDERGRTWLATPPAITMLPLVGHQREPRPISWAEQERLLAALPPHLRAMALFVLNTGVRNRVACNLRWAWEIPVPELGVSVFEVPAAYVKGRRRARAIVCNSVAQRLVEEARGRHPEFVFVWRRERVTATAEPPRMAYRPIETMHNTAWQRARKVAGLPDLHVHDLRHTFGMRLREAGAAQSTVSDLLWHSTGNITAHYSVAMLAELAQATERITQPGTGWNKSLATLRREADEARLREESRAKVAQLRRA